VALTALTSAAEVLVAAEHDPYVRGRLKRPEVEGWAGEGAVAWRFRYSSERAPYLMTHGEPANVALLLEALLPELRDGQDVTVPRGTAALLPAWVALEGATEWDFRWTDEAPPRQPAEAEVRLVEDDEVRPLLELANPDASVQPGDARVRRWLGMRPPHGHLLACAADTSEATGVGHISSIAVHPDRRGHGLGAAVTAALIRQLFADGCDVVTLGMYADNTAGRALYDRLGMHERGFTSGTLRIRSRW
jgi:ribosomal protein S18 acetylase RimI-like enzyme